MVSIDDTPTTGFGIDDADPSLLAFVIFEGPNYFFHFEVVLSGCLESDLIPDEKLNCRFALMASTGDLEAKEGLRNLKLR